MSARRSRQTVGWACQAANCEDEGVGRSRGGGVAGRLCVAQRALHDAQRDPAGGVRCVGRDAFILNAACVFRDDPSETAQLIERRRHSTKDRRISPLDGVSLPRVCNDQSRRAEVSVGLRSPGSDQE